MINVEGLCPKKQKFETHLDEIWFIYISRQLCFSLCKKVHILQSFSYLKVYTFLKHMFNDYVSGNFFLMVNLLSSFNIYTWGIFFSFSTVPFSKCQFTFVFYQLFSLYGHFSHINYTAVTLFTVHAYKQISCLSLVRQLVYLSVNPHTCNSRKTALCLSPLQLFNTLLFIFLLY